MRRTRTVRQATRWLVLLLLVCMVSYGFAQRRRQFRSLDDYRQYNNIPSWKLDPKFRHDVFTFARVRYRSVSQPWGRPPWAIDHPDSDLNFSLRLQQLTSLHVNPDPVVVELTDENLFDYPFLYMIEPGGIELSNDEVAGLRRYCLNGGFLMVDDFWGDWEYDVFYRQIKRVFPDRKVVDLDLSHEIFHNVYKLKEKPQIPSIGWAYDGNTWEVRKGPSAREVHYRAIEDDQKRIMVLICHNTDLGDGWEREGENREYFERFSVRLAYPMGINIVTYAMTH